MTRSTNRVRGLISAYKKRPITLLGALAIAVVGIWLGSIIIRQAPRLLPAQLHLYSGVTVFFDLKIWGYLFVAMGVSSFIRIFFMDFQWSWIFHVPCVLVATAWAIGFDSGPLTTGQPLYTMFAIFVIYQPWMGLAIIKMERLAGFGITPLNPDDNELWNYSEYRKKLDSLETRS